MTPPRRSLPVRPVLLLLLLLHSTLPALPNAIPLLPHARSPLDILSVHTQIPPPSHHTSSRILRRRIRRRTRHLMRPSSISHPISPSSSITYRSSHSHPSAISSSSSPPPPPIATHLPPMLNTPISTLSSAVLHPISAAAAVPAHGPSFASPSLRTANIPAVDISTPRQQDSLIADFFRSLGRTLGLSPASIPVVTPLPPSSDHTMTELPSPSSTDGSSDTRATTPQDIPISSTGESTLVHEEGPAEARGMHAVSAEEDTTRASMSIDREDTDASDVDGDIGEGDTSTDGGGERVRSSAATVAAAENAADLPLTDRHVSEMVRLFRRLFDALDRKLQHERELRELREERESLPDVRVTLSEVESLNQERERERSMRMQESKGRERKEGDEGERAGLTETVTVKKSEGPPEDGDGNRELENREADLDLPGIPKSAPSYDARKRLLRERERGLGDSLLRLLRSIF